MNCNNEKSTAKLKQKRKFQTRNQTDDWKFTRWTLENKKAKSNILRAVISGKLKGEKYSKTFSKVIDRQNIENQTIFELYKLMLKTKIF